MLITITIYLCSPVPAHATGIRNLDVSRSYMFMQPILRWYNFFATVLRLLSASRALAPAACPPRRRSSQRRSSKGVGCPLEPFQILRKLSAHLRNAPVVPPLLRRHRRHPAFAPPLWILRLGAEVCSAVFCDLADARTSTGQAECGGGRGANLDAGQAANADGFRHGARGGRFYCAGRWRCPAPAVPSMLAPL